MCVIRERRPWRRAAPDAPVVEQGGDGSGAGVLGVLTLLGFALPLSVVLSLASAVIVQFKRARLAVYGIGLASVILGTVGLCADSWYLGA